MANFGFARYEFSEDGFEKMRRDLNFVIKNLSGENFTGGSISASVSGTTIANTLIVDSTFTSGSVLNSTIENSHISGSTFTAGQITASTISGSLFTAGTLTASTFSGFVTNSTIANCNITGSTFAGSILNSTIVNPVIYIGTTAAPTVRLSTVGFDSTGLVTVFFGNWRFNGQIGFNGSTNIGKQVVGAALSTAVAGTTTLAVAKVNSSDHNKTRELVNQLRAALTAYGLCT